MQILREHTGYLQKCHACGRVGHDMYKVRVNGAQYIVCSAAHATSLEAEANKEVSVEGEEDGRQTD